MAIAETARPADPQHYLWWFPGSPVKVHLALRVVQRLNHRLSSAGGSNSEDGLLFGGIRDGVTEILDFQPATDTSVPSMVGGLSAERRGALVGYYRSEKGEALQLTERDLSLAKECFAKPYNVFLIIHYARFGPPTATFFFHDRDCRMADFAFLEFPFDPSLLADEQYDRMQRFQQAIEPPIEEAVEQLTAVLPVAPVSTVAPKVHRAKRRFVLKSVGWMGSLAGVFAIGMLFNNEPFRARCAYIWRAISNPPSTTGSPSSPARPVSHPSLSLHATRQNRDLELSWNRDSPLIAAATSGTLSIRDGESTRLVSFDAAQLREGGLLYAPRTDQILMQLTVTTPTGTFAESVTVILPGTGEPQTYAVPAPKPASGPLATSPAPSASAAPVKPSKPFNLPVLSKAVSLNGVLVLQDPPALNDHPAPLAAAPIAVPSTVQPPSLPPPPAQPSRQAPPRVSKYEAPVAVLKTQPKVPGGLLFLITKQTTVQVNVAIDKDGKVTEAEAIPQGDVSKYLVKLAVDAARSWRFKPGLLNQEPIASEMILQFVFNR